MTVQGQRMSVRSLLEQAFLDKWQAVGATNLSPVGIELISENFDLGRIEQAIYAEIDQLTGRDASEAWARHIQRLTHLAQQFAEQLHQTTDGGRTVTRETILEAKTKLRCLPAYPC